MNSSIQSTLPTPTPVESHPYKVLLVEDQEEDAISLQKALHRSSLMRLEVQRVEWLSEALHALSSDAFDVVLVDLFLPDSSGIESVALLHEASPSTPIIALARLTTESLAMEAMRAGAVDYYVKGGTDEHSLARVVRYAIERKRSEERLRLLSEASVLLASSLDYESTLRRIAYLIVPVWADSCVLELPGEAGDIRRIQISSATDYDGSVLGGQPHIESQVVTDAYFEGSLKELLSADTPINTAADSVGSGSPQNGHSEGTGKPTVVTVPLYARSQVIGTITFTALPTRRCYDSADRTMLDELAQRCAVALDNAYLYQKMERSLYARERFIASVSHDLRTPLTAAIAGLGLVEMSIVDRLDRDEARLVGNVRRNVERLAILIDDLIAFGEVESQTLYLQRKPLDLCTVIERSISAMEPMLDDKRQVLEVDLPDTLPYRGDRKRLEHLIVNLLDNAHHHTPSGTVIRIEAFSREDEYIITVSDNGPGIPPGEREAIFERFHGSRARKGGGWGLGLAMARSVVAGHGGRIWADGQEGEGAAFHVALPKENTSGRSEE
ncbi:MAG: ATP-binding protein [Chloroflexota bacterium]